MTDLTVPQDQPSDAASFWQGQQQKTQQQQQADTLRQSVSFGATQDPDAYAKLLRQAAVTGVAPTIAKDYQPELKQAATLAPLDFNQLVQSAPKLSQWASNPDNAAVSHDDLSRLAEIEASSNAPSLASLSSSQRQAVIEERKRVYLESSKKNEVTSAIANTNTGFYSPFLNFGANAISALDAGAATANEATSLVAGLHDPSTAWDLIKQAWRHPGQGGIGEVAQNAAGAANQYLASPIKTGVQQYLTDPQTKQQFENPDFQTFGKSMPGRAANAVFNRGSLNAVSSVPGALAGFMVGGEVGGAQAMPTMMAGNAMMEKHAAAVAAGANDDSAWTEGIGSGLLNYAMMTAMPEASPTTTRIGALGQALGRGTAMGMGMTAGENILAGLHDPDRKLFEGMAPNLVSMIAFETAGSIPHMIELASESKLRQRDPVAFANAVGSMLQNSGQESVRIPVDAFDTYFQGQKMDPAEIAANMGVTDKYLEAQHGIGGGDLVIPTSEFLSEIDPKYQAALIPDLKLHQDDMTMRQRQEWTQSGGPEKLAEATRQMVGQNPDQIAANEQSPEWQSLKDTFKQRFVEGGGLSDSVADTHAELMANVYTNLARESGLKPNELLRIYDPKIMLGDAPEAYNGNGEKNGDQAPARDPREVQRSLHRDAAVEADDAGKGHDGTAPEGASWRYARALHGDGDQSRVLGARVHESWMLNPEQKAALEAQGKQSPDIHELDYNDPKAVEAFRSAIAKTKEGNKYAASVHVYEPEEYAHTRMFLSEDGKAGFALKPDGDIVSLFTHGDGPKGASHTMLEIAKQAGGTKMDAFDTVLPGIYGDHGFKATSRMSWNDEYAPEGWDKSTFDKYNHGEPDVVFMAHDPAAGAYKAGDGEMTDDYGHATDLQTAAVRQSHPENDPLFQSVSLRDGRETLKKYGLDPDKSYTVREVAQALEDRQAKKYGTIEPDDRSPESAKKIAKWMAEEVAFEQQHPEASGVGWYSEKFQRALDVFSDEFPELKTDQNARDTLTALIAITSDGQSVVPNFQQAIDLYGNFRKSGDFSSDRSHNRQASIDNNLGILKNLIDEKGPEETKKYLLQEATVSELKKIATANGIKFSTDYQAHIKLPMAAIVFGPKLGAFYANLMGSEGYLTMDRWWSRTFNRYRGDLIPEPTQQGLTRLKGLLGNPEMSDQEATEATKPLRKSYEAKGFKDGTELEKAGNTIWKAAYGELNDSPNNASDRTFMLDTVAQAQKALKRKGIDMSVADIQATLWYYEKRLYGELGARQSQDVSYEEAAHRVIDSRRSGDDQSAGPAAPGDGGTTAEAGSAEVPAAAGASQGHAAGEPLYQSDRFSGRQPGDELFNSGSPNQLEQGQKRGWFNVNPDGTFTIGKTKFGDLSTFVHEPAHSYLFMLRDLAGKDGASDQLKGDYQKALDFLGAKDGEPLTREQHEKWATANEQYLRTGEAPSKGLRGVFQRFAVWMSSVYKKATDLGVELSPEIKGVFDRMYQSSEGVNNAHDEVAGEQLFKSPEEAGWTDAQFQKYAEAKGMEVDKAKQEILAKMDEANLRTRSAQWQKDQDNVRQAVTEQVDQDPTYKAIKQLRKGATEDGSELRLSKEEMIKQFGEERTAALQKQHPGLYRIGEGMDPEGASDLLGFDSADHMMRSLEGAPKRADAIEGRTHDEMVRQFGDIRYDGSLQDEARLAVANEQRGENLRTELDALSRMAERNNTPEAELKKAQKELDSLTKQQEADAKAKQDRTDKRDMTTLANGLLKENAGKEDAIIKRDQRISDLKQQISDLQDKAKQATQDDAAGQKFAKAVPPLADFAKSAHDMIQAKAIRDLSPYSYLQAQRQFSREAFVAMGKGDYWGAREAKQKELINHFLYREAVAEQKFVGKFENYVKQLQGKGTQGKLGKAGGSYQDQVNSLLGRYELQRQTNQTLDQRAQTLQAWSDEQYANGKDSSIDPSILNEARKVNYREASVAEIHALRDALVNIHHLALQELGITVNGQHIAYDSAKQEMIQSLRDNFKTTPLPIDINMPKSLGEGVMDFVHRGDALLMKMERLIDWMDGGKIDGPWHQYVWNNIADAQGHEYDLAEKVTGKLGAILEDMPKEQRMRMLETYDIEGVGKVTRKFILSAALNMGNEDNQTKLQKGWGWDAATLGKMMDHLNADDWKFVQKIWDTIDEFWPEISALEKRMSGLEPVRVERRPFDAKDANGNTIALMKGGYYPLLYDPAHSTQGAKQETGDLNQMFEAGYARATTPKGHTIERTAFAAPLLMDYEQVLTGHTAKVIKDLTHREAVIAANHFFTDQEVRNALQETTGSAYEKQMLPWLRGVVNDRNGSATQGLGDFSKLMMTMRSNLVLSTMSFKATTALLQLTHLPRIMQFVKPTDFGQAMVDLIAHPQGITDQVRGLSPNEMAHRGDNLDRDLRSELLSQVGKSSLRHDVARFGMTGISYVDHAIAVPLWLGSYRGALREGLSGEDAVNTADRAVRLGMGAGSPKDLAPIMRSDGLAKILTMFYGFHNGNYNQVRDVIHNTNGVGDIPKMSLGLGLSVLVPAVLSSMVMGKGPKKDDNPALWAIEKSLLFAGDTIPILRDVLTAMERGGDYKFSPVATALEKAGKAGYDSVKDGKPDKFNTGLEWAEAGSYLAGIPGVGQLAKTARYAHQVSQGKVQNPNLWDAVVGGGGKKK